MKTLTVSIAAYNVEKYLEKTLMSIVACGNNLKDIEILVIDDGATDKSLDIAMFFEKKHPGIVRAIHKDNGGYGSTINYGIEEAQGKYFKQLDGDDWYETDNLNMFVDYLKKSDADLVLSPYRKCYENYDEVVDNFKELPASSVSISNLNGYSDIMMHELTIKTELLKLNNIKITEKCFYTDTEYVMYPLMKALTVARFDKCIYCYRLGQEEQSVSTKGILNHYEDMMYVTKKLNEAYENEGEVIKSRGISDLINSKMVNILTAVYIFYLVGTEKNNKALDKLKEFDNDLRLNHKILYKKTMRVKRVAILRLSNFLLWKIMLCSWKNGNE